MHHGVRAFSPERAEGEESLSKFQGFFTFGLDDIDSTHPYFGQF